MTKSCDFTLNDLEYLKEQGYKYIVKAADKFLSGWGEAKDREHVQLIALKDYDDVYKLTRYLRNNKNEFSYINWTFISNVKTIKNYVRNRTYTLRNDWVRGLD